MPRATNSVAAHRRKKRVLAQAKGFRGTRHKHFTRAKEVVDRAMAMSFEHRRDKKRDYRGLWISRLSAACKINGITYSRFIEGLTKAQVAINRKMLSEIAIHDAPGFTSIVEIARKQLKAA